MPSRQFDNVSSRFGAPMGRKETGDKPKGKVSLFRVRFVDGDYDDGGAYWGNNGVPLYCARGESIDGDGFLRFIRATSRKEAQAKLGL